MENFWSFSFMFVPSLCACLLFSVQIGFNKQQNEDGKLLMAGDPSVIQYESIFLGLH